ncbi:acyl-CoA N-acyltransferase [Mycena latifolia]|nr:acyl-CoA N-acyltransferase [Mycena latifolia]
MPDQFSLRPIRSHDIPALIHLHTTLLPLPYSHSFFLQLLLQPTRVCLVAHDRSQSDPVAFISAAAAIHPEQRIQILTLGVLPTFRQHRLATRLVYAAIDVLAGTPTVPTAVFAQVSVSNAPANSFYRHLGLHPCKDVVRDMYRNLPGPSRDGYIVSGRIIPRRDEPDSVTL